MDTLSTGTSSIITWPENLSKKLLEGLAQGKESATQLQTLLHNPKPFDWSISAIDLADKILTSLTDSISVVTSVSKNNHSNKDRVDVLQCSSDHDRLSSGIVINGGQSNEVVSRINAQQEPLDHDHSHCDDRSSEDSGQSSKKKRPAVKDQRGCYKRRKSSQSWSTVGSTIEDGQAWRKYGQKQILNAEFPRAYFRCTRKHDQGCKATKQVQQIQDNPKVYNTIYIGQHTCKITLKAPQMIVDSQPYNNTQLSNDDHHHLVNPNYPHHESRKDHTNNWASKPDNCDNIFSIPLKKEDEDHDQNVTSKENQSEGKSSFETDYLWSDFKDIEISDPSLGLLSSNIVNKPKFMGSEDGHGIDDDVVDSIAFSFDEDEFVVKSMDFRDCDFHFDENEFPIELV